MKKIKTINIPIVISFAENDELVPSINSENLFNEANEPKSLFKIKGANHSNSFNFFTPEYLELIKNVIF